MPQTTSEHDLYQAFHQGTAANAAELFGCHYQPATGMHRFCLWAPRAHSVDLVGDFNDWQCGATPMEEIAAGIFAVSVPGLKDGALYKYCLHSQAGRQLKADPYAFHSETGPGTASKVWQLADYPWQDGDYLAARARQNPQQAALAIYELHLGSWRHEADSGYPWYRQIATELADYCLRMGYTHVELMPLTEYPFDGSWGYQTTGYFAPTSRYGTPQDFMYLVDHLHQQGIGVILDWAPGHFPRDAHGLARFDGAPLYEPEHPLRADHPEWGTLTFDYSRGEVASFLISSAMHFFDCYHIDGIRVDAVSSMLYLDYGRKPGQFLPNAQGGNINLDAVAFLQRLNQTILTKHPGTFTVAEESTAYPLVTRPPDVGGLGFSFKWDMGFMHDTLEYLSMDPLYRGQHHEKLTFSMLYAFSENFILPFSHDEVVHGKCSLLDKMFGSYEQKFASLRLLFGYQYAHPGKKLHFMGSEFGQFIEWDYSRQLDWFLLEYPQHAAMQRWLQALNRFYRQQPQLWQIEDSWDGYAWRSVDERAKSAVAFARLAPGQPDLLCACNFSGLPQSLAVGLPQSCYLQECLNSDDPAFGGSGECTKKLVLSEPRPCNGYPHAATLQLPPLSVLYYEQCPLPAEDSAGSRLHDETRNPKADRKTGGVDG